MTPGEAGRTNRFVSPRPGLIGRVQDRLGNPRAFSRLRRAVLGRLPFPVLASDVGDVVYATWAVPIGAARAFVPAGVELVERNGLTLLTVLSYRHGHFGPALAGPLRRLFPSPRQSNWRFYVERLHGRPPPEPTVLFIRNVFSSALYALGTRLGSDALPSHLAARFALTCDERGCTVELDEGGSAPGLTLRADASDDRTVPAAMQGFFGSWPEAIATLASQDAAVAAVEDITALALARIDLPVPLDEVRPLQTSAFRPGRLLTELGATADPFCFLVPCVPFRVLSERLIAPPA